MPTNRLAQLRALLLSSSLLLTVVVTGCSSKPPETKTLTPPRQAQPVREASLVACLDRFAGRYSAESELPSHPDARLKLTLVLERDWKSSLTTEYAGSLHPATVESGTWRCDNARAHVLLTSSNKGPVRIELTFERRDSQLVSTQFDRKLYGPAGLSLTRQ
jgi:hypothetical protein